MSESTAELPDDIEALCEIIAAQAKQLRSRDTLIEKLKAQLAVLKRARFGTSSEKLERAIAQLELSLEEIEATALVSRDIGRPMEGLGSARSLLPASRDLTNAAHAGYLEASRLLLICRLDEAERILDDLDPGALPLTS